MWVTFQTAKKPHRLQMLWGPTGDALVMDAKRRCCGYPIDPVAGSSQQHAPNHRGGGDEGHSPESMALCWGCHVHYFATSKTFFCSSLLSIALEEKDKLPSSQVSERMSLDFGLYVILENWVTGARSSDKRLFLAELIHWFSKCFPLANYLLEGTKWWRISFLWPVQVRSSFLLLLPWPIHIMLHVSVHLSVLVTEVNSNCLQKVNFLTKSIPEICFTVELYSQIITLKCIFFEQCSGLIPA